MYSTGNEGVWIHLYHNSRAKLALENGVKLLLTQRTAYPWDGTVEIIFENAPAGDFGLFLRMPFWADEAAITVNEQVTHVIHKPGSYYEIRRKWNRSDRVRIVFEMPIRVVYSNPDVRENRGCVAIQRGPVIYCLESIDHSNISVFDVVLPVDSSGAAHGLKAKFEPDLLGGIVTISGSALTYDPPSTDESLYSFESFDKYLKPVSIQAISYFSWANRGSSDMTVWIPSMTTE